MNAAPPDALRPGAMEASRVRRTLALCAAAALFEGFDNQSMGVAAPLVFREYSIAPSQAGVIFSAATLGLFFGAAIGGRVADCLGRRHTLVLSLLLFGIFSVLTSLVHTTQMLAIARLLTGLGCGSAMPAFISMASEAVDPRRRLSAVTLVMAALPFGGALAGVMALGDRLGWGWRSIFIVGGIAPILAALAVPIAFRQAHSGNQAAGVTVTAPSLEVARIRTILWGARRARTTLLLWTGFFFTQLVLFLMLNWLPTLIVGLGFSRTEASLASISFNLAGSLGAVSLGRFHAGARRRLWVILTYGGITAALMGLVAMASYGTFFPVAILASSIAGIFIIGAQLILFALAPLYYPTVNRGTGVGASVAMGRLGSVVGPLFAATVLAAGSDSAMVLAGIVPFVLVAGAAALALTWQAQSAE
jgi:MFS transporter, AAHS family, 3-hydroxyphenylpropionic acid transporter